MIHSVNLLTPLQQQPRTYRSTNVQPSLYDELTFFRNCQNSSLVTTCSRPSFNGQNKPHMKTPYPLSAISPIDIMIISRTPDLKISAGSIIDALALFTEVRHFFLSPDSSDCSDLRTMETDFNRSVVFWLALPLTNPGNARRYSHSVV